MYAPDEDVVIYDALPPIRGFRGFNELRSEIYPGLQRIDVQRTGEVVVRELSEGDVVITCYSLSLEYDFAEGRTTLLSARISQVWERREDGYRIVHEHPSTVHEVA